MSTGAATRTPIITSRWGISVGLFVAIVGGIFVNVAMYFENRENNSVTVVKLEAVNESVTKIEDAVLLLTSSLQAEVRALWSENASLRERVSRLEARAN